MNFLIIFMVFFFISQWVRANAKKPHTRIRFYKQGNENRLQDKTKNTDDNSTLGGFTDRKLQHKSEKNRDEVSVRRSRIKKIICGIIILWCGLILAAILYVFFG